MFSRPVTVMLIAAFCMAIASCSSPRQKMETPAIVPFPVNFYHGNGYFLLDGPLTVSFGSPELKPALSLLEDLSPVGVRSEEDGDAHIRLGILSSLSEEEYTVQIEDDVRILGGSYTAVIWGIVSVMQLLENDNGKYRLPHCEIADRPVLPYRAFMLDVAREWHEIPVIKQMIDLCAWYKVRYLQLHLSDNESFTFPSQAYPALATAGRHYTLEELRALVDYASARGIILIPELDGPGHTAAMRKAMPELFGAPELGIIDIAQEKTLEAMETLIGEMMDVFHTSPYFHIGADEVWLEPFSKQPATAIKIKEHALADAHDLYLQYIARMHAFVRSKGKQTIAWESFDGNGSERVKIPQDLLVIAWETLYQRPDSLVKNGYRIINASWKPLYITPGRRWNAERIYKWNARRWENFWEVTPAYRNPIQLDSSAPVLGAQMCSWEMTGAMELPLVRRRLPAFSERAWSPDGVSDVNDFKRRMNITDSLFEALTFPVKDISTGFVKDESLEADGVRRFRDSAIFSVKPLRPGQDLHFTEDGSMPNANSPLLPERWVVRRSGEIRLGLFENKIMKGYRVQPFEQTPFEIVFSGSQPLHEDVDRRNPEIHFNDTVLVEAVPYLPHGMIRYSLNGEDVNAFSPVYSAPVKIDSSVQFKARYFDSLGVEAGRQLQYRLRKNSDDKQ
jgi:hexosaminidase